ncbi:muscarinic acetylcholine receptor M5b [Erpetoichthys calabaricus]|uniref:muscarinic acetylcholine receptor M5b n=1 Tax=Erpetoichthys calabaricus TaxID=27687 RepID=UPI002234CFE8|nr:muscarinic acetylcholine receptor M5b [Erpetoichthys calabaricus]
MSEKLMKNLTAASDNMSSPQHLGGHRLWHIITIATLSAIASLITITGNILVMISFKVNSQLKTVNNYYLLSLAFADLIIGVFSMNLYTSYILMGYWSLGSLACDLWLALDYVASNASVMNLLVISFDRYFSITRPLTYRAKRTPKRAGIMIGLAWLISFILWAPAILCWQYFVGERTVRPDECRIQFFTEPIITFGTAIAAFYIPVSIMTILYWRIYKETEKRTKDLAELQGSNSPADPRTTKPQKVLLKTCFNCKQQASTGREQTQTSWSSSSRSTATKMTSTQSSDNNWTKNDQEASFSGYPSSEEDDRHVSKPIFQQAFKSQSNGQHESAESEESSQTPHKEDAKLSSYKNSTYFTSPTKYHLQKTKKGLSYKFKSVAKDSSKAQCANDCSQLTPSACSSAESVGQASSKSLDPNLKNQITKRKRMVLIKEKKAAQTLSAILLAFILTWTPYNIIVLISTFCSECIPVSLWHLGYWLCYVNSTINPICYALCNKTFQKTFKMLLFCQWRKKRAEQKLYWSTAPRP